MPWSALAACTEYYPAKALGAVTNSFLTEASGLAASELNPGVVWTHNDGARSRIYAYTTNGALLATFSLGEGVEDLEAITVGPGPVQGHSYLYAGDIGGGAGGARQEIKILRAPEPHVDLLWAEIPKTGNLPAPESFTLRYPEGAFDAEALFIDPVLLDLYVVTKQETGARLYRASLAGLLPGAIVQLQLAATTPFAQVSDAGIAPDGSGIALRREDFLVMWSRQNQESVAAALARTGRILPLVGPPTEPNGEGFTFLRDGSGYLTVSEGERPTFYYFQSTCPTAPRFVHPLENASAFVGGSATISGLAVGYPAPAYFWTFNGQPLSGEHNPILLLTGLSTVQAGTYTLTASNQAGFSSTSATVEVRSRPNLRITEVQSSTAPSPDLPTEDWWELTSFENQPVDLAGWRFNDNAGGWDTGFPLPPNLVIAPGETLVLVENLSAEQFAAWWGANNLPAGLRIITYAASGLSFGAAGDGVRLWNAAMSDPVATVDFGGAQNGVTFNFDPITLQFGNVSQLGQHGVIRAAAAPDIGSPGRIRAPATAPVLIPTLITGHLRLQFQATAGWAYTLQTAPAPHHGLWTSTGNTWQPTADGFLTVELPLGGGENAFYRLLMSPR